MTDLAPVTYNVTTGDLSYDNGAGPISIPYTGPKGDTGSTGTNGQGVPIGGTAAQCLVKNSGTDYDTSWGASGGGSNLPGGRLTLVSGTPVMTADAVAQSTVYYAPDNDYTVPIWDGSNFQPRIFTSSDSDVVGGSLALDSNSAHTNYHQNDKIFDLFEFWNAGVCLTGTGPAWSTSTVRGTGAGTTEIQRIRGKKTNKNNIVLRWGINSGDTITVPANQATYVGSMYCTANGQTGMAYRPTRASGGTNNKLALYNEYNRRPIKAICADSTSTWADASATVRSANNSTSNRIWWLDGSGEIQVEAITQATVSPNSTSANAYTHGPAFNATNQLGIATINQGAFVGATNVGQTSSAFDTTALLGWNYVQFCEQSTTVSMTVYGNGFSALKLDLWH